MNVFIFGNFVIIIKQQLNHLNFVFNLETNSKIINKQQLHNN